MTWTYSYLDISTRSMGHLEIRGEGNVSDRKHPRHKHYTR